MKRTLVIGDIHGGLKALIQVLERASISNDDSLIFLGDYVDGWSEAAELVDYLIDLSQKQFCIFIKGNHDVWCEEWLKFGMNNDLWLKHGGRMTLESYQRIAVEKWEVHERFFQKMPFYYIDEQNRLFIHAGFTSMHGPKEEFYQSNFSWDRTLWEMALTMDKRIKKDSTLYPKRLLLFDEIYIGHTPTLNYDVSVPMQGCNVWNIDTGAAFTGKLTIMDIDTKQFWQSDAVQDLYPYEMGRNRH
jgi:serine/threonine protein phosphatase 1